MKIPTLHFLFLLFYELKLPKQCVTEQSHVKFYATARKWLKI